MMSPNIKRTSFIALTVFGMFFVTGLLAAPVAVPTYHYDTFRTGWNDQETTLTATSFPSTFAIITTVALDDQVDAQPLLVPGLTIAGGTHDVIYVVTESNTVYAIDASSGAILLSRNLGNPVPTPLGCNNNGPNVGITGTPVIDLTTQTLYLIAYVKGSPPTYQLHALNLSNLNDSGSSPVTVAASHTLTNGSVYTFNAAVQRQRPGLLELNGNIYAAFGSFCDFKSSLSRGWILGWTASTLAPLAGNRLDDTLVTSPTNYFLSSIWMSGYGISGGGTGSGARLLFSTGNSDPGTNGANNIEESIVKTDGNPANLLGIFTPSNAATLDRGDTDFGSGGAMLLPTQSGNVPYLAVGAGKDGRLFLLNRLSMSTPLETHQLEGCWCGPSYFVGSDGVGRIVTSQGSTIITWKLVLSPSPHLVQEGSVNITNGQDPGFFTVVSSNGTQAGTGIIWAVGRPKSAIFVNLFAFAATASGGTYKLLFSSSAGSWPNTGGNANIVPVVANGKVYVASNKALAIFGVPSGLAPQIALQPGPVAITGTLLAIDGSTLTLQTRTGKTTKIDESQAAQNEQVGILSVGEPITVQGSSFTATGALLATSIVRAKGSSDLWPPDQ
jgi:hypothetical protein